MSKKKIKTKQIAAEEKPRIVHFEYMTTCPECRHRWSGMYKLGENEYLCVECYENKSK